MRKFILALIGISILQSVLLPRLGTTGPDLFFLLLFFSALSAQPEAATLMGFFLGLCQDALSGSPLGLRAFTLSFIGFLTARLSLRLDTSKLFPRFLLLLFLAFLSSLITVIFLHFLLHEPFGPILIRPFFPEVLTTTGLGLFLFGIPKFQRSFKFIL